MQALTEAKLVGAQWAAVGCLRVGFSCEFDIYPVPLHQDMWRRLVEAVEAFWESVERDTPPPPDYSRDGKLLMALQGGSDGSTIDLSGDNELIHALHERERTRQLLGVIEADADRIDTLIRHKVGPAEAALAGDWRITLQATPARGLHRQAEHSAPAQGQAHREAANRRACHEPRITF